MSSVESASDFANLTHIQGLHYNFLTTIHELACTALQVLQEHLETVKRCQGHPEY